MHENARGGGEGLRGGLRDGGERSCEDGAGGPAISGYAFLSFTISDRRVALVQP
jgi:hypothetical protein